MEKMILSQPVITLMFKHNQRFAKCFYVGFMCFSMLVPDGKQNQAWAELCQAQLAIH